MHILGFVFLFFLQIASLSVFFTLKMIPIDQGHSLCFPLCNRVNRNKGLDGCCNLCTLYPSLAVTEVSVFHCIIKDSADNLQ